MMTRHNIDLIRRLLCLLLNLYDEQFSSITEKEEEG